VVCLQIQITALCICVNISASVALACMFVPKVYIVLFQPHKNVRQGATKIKGLAAGGRTIFGHPGTGLNSLDVACPSQSSLSSSSIVLSRFRYYPRQGGYVFIGVCLFVSRITQKSTEPIFTKFDVKVAHGPRKNH